jgi:predicted ATP-dependent endonuclease of OLD family
MKLKKINLSNYKSIKDTGEVSLENINIFAGKNNTGKTALIESIYRVIQGNFKDQFALENKAALNLEIELNDDELSALYENVSSGYVLKEVNKFKLYFLYCFTNNITILNKIDMYNDGAYKPFYTNTSEPGKNQYVIKNDKGGGITHVGTTPGFILNLMKFLKDKIVYISGSRFVPEDENAELNNSLLIDGTNLNRFLYTLHNNNETIFDTIKKTFIQIFSDVETISTPISIGNKTNVSLVFHGNPTPIPLYNCGSGLTHTLLLLCVYFTKDKSVVLYDEPQVFLHPSAEKAIYDIISRSEKHQYLLTTHSPILINYPFNKNIFHVRKEDGVSIFTTLDKIQKVLSDIGVKNSDFALSDKVLFVEGETEEVVIPIILSFFGFIQIGYNYRIIKMKGTGNEFSKKSAMTRNKQKLDMVLGEISESPIPYKIIIDLDEKTEEKIEEIKSKYDDNVVILKRREYENLFLDCYNEIAEVINEDKVDGSVSPVQIEAEIRTLLLDTKDKKLYPKDTKDALKNVVGSEILERIFLKYSVFYNKITHGLRLTEKTLKNKPELFEFLINELEDFLKRNKTQDE